MLGSRAVERFPRCAREAYALGRIVLRIFFLSAFECVVSFWH